MQELAASCPTSDNELTSFYEFSDDLGNFEEYF